MKNYIKYIFGIDDVSRRERAFCYVSANHPSLSIHQKTMLAEELVKYWKTGRLVPDAPEGSVSPA